LVAQKQAGLSGGNGTLRRGSLVVAAKIAALQLWPHDKKDGASRWTRRSAIKTR
jgi:hypothetical protein